MTCAAKTDLLRLGNQIETSIERSDAANVMFSESVISRAKLSQLTGAKHLLLWSKRGHGDQRSPCTWHNTHDSTFDIAATSNVRHGFCSLQRHLFYLYIYIYTCLATTGELTN